MTAASCFLYAKKIVFSKRLRATDTGSAGRSIIGAVICIALSLVPLVTMLSVTDGMLEGVTSRMINLFSHDISVTVSSAAPCTSSCESFMTAAEKLLDTDGVEAVFPEIRSMGLAASSSYRSGAYVRGVEPDIFLRNEAFSSLFEFIEGEKCPLGERRAVIGQKIAEDLGVHTGDPIRIISVSTIQGRVIPRVAQYRVSAVVSSGYQELDAMWVFVSAGDAFDTLAKTSCDFVIGIGTSDPFSSDLNNVAGNVWETLLENAEYGDTGLRPSVATWQGINGGNLENFYTSRALLLVILAVIVIVAVVNVSASVLMIVMERKREIALLKCVGASSGGISFAFVLTGFLIGVMGVLIGIPLGLVCAVNINSIINGIENVVNFFENFAATVFSYSRDGEFYLLNPAYYLQNIPIRIPFLQISGIAFGTLALSTLSAVIPSIKAGREKPCDTLRKT